MKKIEYLEGLRGAAAFTVFITHFVQLFYPSMVYGETKFVHSSLEVFISKSILNLFYNGSLAVCVFFVLSGYVLSIRFLRSKDYEILYSSATRRYFRLGIPSAFSILIGYILIKADLFYYSDIVEQTKGYNNNHYSSEITFVEMINQFFGSYFIQLIKVESLNPVLWTMKYELLGSFLIFILMAIFSVFTKRLYVISSYVILAIILFILNYGYFSAFVLGLLISEIENSKYALLLKKSNISYVLLGIGIYIGSYPYVNIEDSIYYVLSFLPFTSVFYHVLGAFLIILSFKKSKFLQTLFSKKAFVFLGKVSFSLYLIHYILLFSFSAWIFSELTNIYSYHISCLITFIISTVLLLITSFLMYKYVDILSVKISSKIYMNIFKRFHSNLIARIIHRNN